MTIIQDIFNISQSVRNNAQTFSTQNAQEYLNKIQKLAETIQAHLAFLEKNYDTKLSMKMKSHDLRDIKFDGFYWAAPHLFIGSTQVSEFNFIAQPQYSHLLQDGGSIKAKQTWKLLSDFISAFHTSELPCAGECTINITSKNSSIDFSPLIREVKKFTMS